MRISELESILASAKTAIGDAEIVIGNRGTKSVKTSANPFDDTEQLDNGSHIDDVRVTAKWLLITTAKKVR